MFWDNKTVTLFNRFYDGTKECWYPTLLSGVDLVVTKGINVTIRDNAISIDFHVIVSYGVSILAVTDNLIESVKYKVEELTGMTVEKINIYVEGVRVID